MKNRRFGALLALGLIAALLSITSVQAFDVDDLKISPTKTVDQRRYDPILQSSPSGASQSPSICRNAAYCDTIDLTIEVPASFTDNWVVQITVTWEDIAESDIDVFFYDKTEARLTSSESARQPETMSGKSELLDPGLHFITALNWVGVHEYYDVKAEFIPVKKQTGRLFSPPPTAAAPATEGPAVQPPDRFSESPPEGTALEAEEPAFSDPVTVDLGEERPRTVGFTTTQGRETSSTKWDGGRLGAGLGALGAIALISYLLLFLPRRTRLQAQGPAPPAG